MSVNPMDLLQMIAAIESHPSLRRQKLLPPRLAALVRELAVAGDLEVSPTLVRLNPAALRAFEQYCREHAGSAPWILPQHQHYCMPLPQTVIVLPKNQ